jgi:hypothetical protein
VKNGTYYQIPASPQTDGHGTSGDAKWWKHLLPELLSDAKPGQQRRAARSPRAGQHYVLLPRGLVEGGSWPRLSGPAAGDERAVNC